jgi:glutamine synthetase
LAGYFDAHPGDVTDDLRREIADYAEAFGIEIEISHHEVALGQNEIDFKYGEALETADRAITMKMCGKVVAARNGYVTTYMPKPFQGINGSGMHCHQSLWSLEGENLFYSEDARNGYLSDLARHYIGGQLAHGPIKWLPCSFSWPNCYNKASPRYESSSLPCMGTQEPQSSYVYLTLAEERAQQEWEIRCPGRRRNTLPTVRRITRTGLETASKTDRPWRSSRAKRLPHMSYEERIGTRHRLPARKPQGSNRRTRNSDLMKETLGPITFENFLKEKTA